MQSLIEHVERLRRARLNRKNDAHGENENVTSELLANI